MKIFKFLDGKINLKLGKKTLNISKRILALILVVAIIAISVSVYLIKKNDNANTQLITAQVTRGNIQNIIEGTGQVQAIDQYEITSLAKGDIIADYFEEGDYVQEGQLLYEIDSSSAQSTIERAQSSLEKAQMNYEQSADDVSNLNIKSDISGVITSLNVKKGDQIGNNSVVATVIDKENLLLKVPFNENDARNLYIGQDAVINLENNSTPIYGTVSRVATGSVINSYGVAVTNVEIDVKNPGSVVPGDRATVVAGDYACNDAGTFEYKNESTITAKVSGKAVSVNFSEGDKVYAGATIVVLESDSVTTSARSNRLSLNDAQQSLEDAKETLEDYSIKAPISGKVLEKTAKAGEKLDQNSSSTMAIIADLSVLTFEMNIDELDINKIEVGQKVSIVADSMEDKTFTGTVTNIKYFVELASQGVTNYPVTVTIDDSENTGLLPNMNVTGSIVVESVENVLMVPVSAVRRGNLVIVKDDGTVNTNTAPTDTENGDKQNQPQQMPEGERPQMPDGEMPQGERPQMPDGEIPQNEAQMPEGDIVSSVLDLFTTTAYAAQEDSDKQQQRLENMKSQLDVPEGYTVVQVVTGLGNGSFIEIKSGLSEGQTVLLPDTTQNTNQQNQQGMMGGMPGGGMQGGGMPGGGMSGGGGMPGGGMRR